MKFAFFADYLFKQVTYIAVFINIIFIDELMLHFIEMLPRYWEFWL